MFLYIIPVRKQFLTGIFFEQIYETSMLIGKFAFDKAGGLPIIKCM